MIETYEQQLNDEIDMWQCGNYTIKYIKDLNEYI